MIHKKNKKVIYTGKKNKADWATDHAYSYKYNGSNKVYGERYTVKCVFTDSTSYLLNQRIKHGVDLADA